MQGEHTSSKLLPTHYNEESAHDGISHDENLRAGGSVVPADHEPASADGGRPQKRHKRGYVRSEDGIEEFTFGLVLISTIPIALLVAYASRFSNKLGSSACLTNGDFILPGTASIWNSSYLFTVTIPLGVDSYWSYTHVRILDIMWDVLLGRAGQAVLIWVAYRVYHKAISFLMQTESIGYDTYGAVAFDTGSCGSVLTFFKALVAKKPSFSWKRCRVLGTLVLTTLYIVAMPTLLSATTGYAAVFTPSIETEYDLSGAKLPATQVVPCVGESNPTDGVGLVGAWGIGYDAYRCAEPSTECLYSLQLTSVVRYDCQSPDPTFCSYSTAGVYVATDNDPDDVLRRCRIPDRRPSRSTANKRHKITKSTNNTISPLPKPRAVAT